MTLVFAINSALIAPIGAILNIIAKQPLSKTHGAVIALKKASFLAADGRIRLAGEDLTYAGNSIFRIYFGIAHRE